MMGFGTAVKTCLRNYANFYGRAQRSEYWWFTLFFYGPAIPLLAWGFYMDARYGYIPEEIPPAAMYLMMAALPFWLGLLIPKLAVMVRRLHDLGMSGWFVLINLFPYVGPLLTTVLLAIPGTKGDNAYGDDPLDTTPKKDMRNPGDALA